MITPRRILVRAPNWIGDHILAYPFFHHLRSAFPKAYIGVSCVPWVSAVQFRNLVNAVYVLPKAESSSFFAKWKALEEGAELLKKVGPWDLGICLPNSFSSAWLLKRAGVRERRGYSADGRGFLLTERLFWDRSSVTHRSDAYLKLLPKGAHPGGTAREFWGVFPLNELDPKVPGILSQFDVEKAWPDTEVLEPPKKKYWVLAPGTTAESRRWSTERFAALARSVADETGWEGLIVGGPAEADVAKSLSEDESLKLQNWTAKGAVTSYWKIFRHAQFTVSNDSGLAHVASLCGSSVQVVWGAGNPNRTEPLGPGRVRVTLNPVDCWPCESNTCSQLPHKKLDCLKGIFSDAVWKEIKAGIEIPGSGTR